MFYDLTRTEVTICVTGSYQSAGDYNSRFAARLHLRVTYRPALNRHRSICLSIDLFRPRDA